MKTLIRILLVQCCCIPLLVTDAMARDGDNKGKSKNKSSGTATARPTIRPDKSANRNPLTGSKAQRPEAKPASRPTTRPTVKPQAPATRPANKPDIPGKPQAKPADRPKLPNKPEAKPADRPKLPNKPEAKPADRPKLPNKPEAKPADRPNRPETKPANKPNLPNRPETKPAVRPDLPDRPVGKPSTKPNLPNRPNKPEARPETKPGNVNYPKPQKPVTLPGNVNRPDNNRPNINRPNQKPEVKPGKNTRPIRKPQFENKEINVNNKSGNKSWWNSNKNINNNTNITNITNNKVVYKGDTNVRINNNFKNNVNWSTNRKNWGYNPWWNRPATRPWYGGSWNCGWNNNYYRRHHHYSHSYYYGGYRPPGYVIYDDHHNDVAQAIGWGLVGWSLGKLIFDSGYQTYSNPYPAQPVPSAKGTQITYTQPITVVAAQTAPAEDDDAGRMTEQSESHIADSQGFFKQGDYLKALDSANKAVAEAPGDGALHEYRALVLFALGKYSEAAGVLNPVLAGGPGWDWTTMVSLYNAQETYMNQLQSLETYSDAKADAADARFLLGYHYMVCGHLDRATVEFAEAARLQPADSVSAQLRDLTAASSNNGDEDAAEDTQEPAAETPPQPAPVPLEKLTGTWVSDKGAQGTVTLAFKDDGKFIWTFTKDDKANEFGGDFSMNDNGLLVLDAEESQMVASVELPQDSELKFVLAGGPPGDPGLVFSRK
jgi:Tfp pilus assembly protein PilF